MKPFFFILILFCFSCAHSKRLANDRQIPIRLERDANLPKYKVTKLDSVENVYLIYAEKNGQLYKIVSRRIDSLDCKNIKVSGEYGFLLESLFHAMISERGDTLWRRLDMVNAVKFNGTTIATENGCVNDIFRADNVIGLCLKY